METIPDGTKVDLYWNLNKRLYSVRVNGRVVAHTPMFSLTNARFSVQKAGRERVLRERRKNVHAFIRGEWRNNYESMDGLLGGVTYNPYKYETFVTRNAETPVHRAIYATGTSFNNSAQLFACGWS